MTPPTYSIHARTAAARRTGGAPTLRSIAAAGLFIGLGWAAPRLTLPGADRWASSDVAIAAPVPAAVPAAAPADGAAVTSVAFVAQGAGTVTAGADLYAAPAGGDIMAAVPKGTAVAIGGVVRVPAGFWTRDVLWVRIGVPSGAADLAAGAVPSAGAGRYGFVAAESVVVTAGTPLRLDVDGVPREAFLAPGSAVSYAGGEGLGGSGDTSGLTAAPAAAAGSTSPGASAAAVAPRDGGTQAAGAAVPSDFSIPWLPATIEAWKPQLLTAGRTHGVDPALLALVMLVESGGNPRAQSPSGATGLMQVMPGTGADIARQRGLTAYSPGALWEVETNIDFGAWYVAQQLKAFGVAGDSDWQTSVELAASAYNGGPGSVQRLLAGGALPAETVHYRRWVGGMWRERADATSPTFDAWWQAGGSRLVAAAEQSSAQGLASQ